MICILIFNCVIPLIILIGGLGMKKAANGKINHIAGYRTTMSMKNKDTWAYAHKECSALWIRYGALLIAGCIVITVISILTGIQVATIMCLVYMNLCLVVIFYSIYKVEKKLKATFDENGNRRQIM